MQKKYVTASELAEYVYCQCCWMDALEGKKKVSFEMINGTESHERIHSSYLLTKYLRKIAVLLILGSIFLLVLLFVLQYISGVSLW